MSTIVTRAGKGSALTHNEVDANFNNLNTDKLQSGNTAAALTITTATFGAGTVSAPAITTSGDTNTGIFFPAADTIAFTEGGVESMRIDASGNLGLRVTPSAWGGYRAVQIGAAGSVASSISGQDVLVGSNAYFDGATDKYIVTGFASRYSQFSGAHVWFTAPSGTAGNAITFNQAMTLDASGNLLVGTTSNNASSGRVQIKFDGATLNGLNLQTTYASTGSYYLIFNNSAGSTTGYISQNGTTSVAYNTSSDYRLKENIAPMTSALAKVAALKPVTYKWKADGSDGEGFIAHELQEVCPDAVTGEKDAVDADGNPKYQGIDTSFLVATLTAAIQELKAEFDAYKAAHP